MCVGRVVMSVGVVSPFFVISLAYLPYFLRMFSLLGLKKIMVGLFDEFLCLPPVW